MEDLKTLVAIAVRRDKLERTGHGKTFGKEVPPTESELADAAAAIAAVIAYMTDGCVAAPVDHTADLTEMSIDDLNAEIDRRQRAIDTLAGRGQMVLFETESRDAAARELRRREYVAFSMSETMIG
jgi:hypothetical protein